MLSFGSWRGLLACLLILPGHSDAADKPVPGTPGGEVVFPHGEVDPVRVTGSVAAGPLRPGDSFAITLVLQVAPTYEIGDLHAALPAVATTLQLGLPEGWEFVGDWKELSSAPSITGDRHATYSGEAIFTRIVRASEKTAPGDYVVTGSVRYQACTAKLCLRPVEKELKLKVKIDP